MRVKKAVAIFSLFFITFLTEQNSEAFGRKHSNSGSHSHKKLEKNTRLAEVETQQDNAAQGEPVVQSTNGEQPGPSTRAPSSAPVPLSAPPSANSGSFNYCSLRKSPPLTDDHWKSDKQLPKGSPGNYRILDGKFAFSGELNDSSFKWLKDTQNVGTDVDLQQERNDSLYFPDLIAAPGGAEPKIKFVYLPVVDKEAPNDTDAYLDAALGAISNSGNKAVEFHCRGGIGRTGFTEALVLYVVYGMKIDNAITLANRHGANMKQTQIDWLHGLENSSKYSSEKLANKYFGCKLLATGGDAAPESGADPNRAGAPETNSAE